MVIMLIRFAPSGSPAISSSDHLLRLVPATKLDGGIDRIAGDEPPVAVARADAARPGDSIQRDAEALLAGSADEQRGAQVGE